MIIDIVEGDIMAQHDKHIIFGINQELEEPNQSIKRYIDDIRKKFGKRLALGSYIEFRLNRIYEQKLYLVVCHNIGTGGWLNADKHVRFAFDSIYYNTVGEYATVRIGNGFVGKRDGADDSSILTSIQTSFLPVRLYHTKERAHYNQQFELIPMQIWTPKSGHEQLMVA